MKATGWKMAWGIIKAVLRWIWLPFAAVVAVWYGAKVYGLVRAVLAPRLPGGGKGDDWKPTDDPGIILVRQGPSIWTEVILPAGVKSDAVVAARLVEGGGAVVVTDNASIDNL